MLILIPTDAPAVFLLFILFYLLKSQFSAQSINYSVCFIICKQRRISDYFLWQYLYTQKHNSSIWASMDDWLIWSMYSVILQDIHTIIMPTHAHISEMCTPDNSGKDWLPPGIVPPPGQNKCMFLLSLWSACWAVRQTLLPAPMKQTNACADSPATVAYPQCPAGLVKERPCDQSHVSHVWTSTALACMFSLAGPWVHPPGTRSYRRNNYVDKACMVPPLLFTSVATLIKFEMIICGHLWIN